MPLHQIDSLPTGKHDGLVTVAGEALDHEASRFPGPAGYGDLHRVHSSAGETFIAYDIGRTIGQKPCLNYDRKLG
ncbi:hypothetical protein ATCCBAA256_36570 [Mycobacterium montefiorense]|nr:hypothetical protein ATCCBAA256_36570 [Mycobacterium montefiorense]